MIINSVIVYGEAPEEGFLNTNIYASWSGQVAGHNISLDVIIQDVQDLDRAPSYLGAYMIEETSTSSEAAEKIIQAFGLDEDEAEEFRSAFFAERVEAEVEAASEEADGRLKQALEALDEVLRKIAQEADSEEFRAEAARMAQEA